MIGWTEQQQMVRGMIRDFVEKEVVPQLDDIEYNGVPPYDILRKMIKTFGMDVMAMMAEMPLRNILMFLQSTLPMPADQIMDGLLMQLHDAKA